MYNMEIKRGFAYLFALGSLILGSAGCTFSCPLSYRYNYSGRYKDIARKDYPYYSSRINFDEKMTGKKAEKIKEEKLELSKEKKTEKSYELRVYNVGDALVNTEDRIKGYGGISSAEYYRRNDENLRNGRYRNYDEDLSSRASSLVLLIKSTCSPETWIDYSDGRIGGDERR